MRDFRKYDVLRLSHELTLEIYLVTKTFPASEKFQLVTQMQRAAYSIPSNFCEGCGRDSDKDFNRFIKICFGSAHELEYFILLVKDLSFIKEETYNNLTSKVNEIKKKLFNLSKRFQA